MQDRVTQPMAVRVVGVKKTVTLSLTVAGWFGLCAAAPACRAADVPPAADGGSQAPSDGQAAQAGAQDDLLDARWDSAE